MPPTPTPTQDPDAHADDGRSTTGPLRVWPNHVLGVQTHTKWGAGAPPRPREPLSALPVGSNLPGNGVRVGVLDTGIEDQPWLAGHWAPAAGRSPATVAEQLGDPATLRYQGGHGSFVIGTILQHAPGAEIIVDRLDDSMGCIDDWQLHTRLSALLDRTNRLDVLNLSLGGYTADNRPMPGVCTVLDGALDANPDLVVVASAGNDGLDRFLWPAALSRVVGVGATAVAAAGGPQRWPESNFGEWVDAWSLGEDLSSTFLRFPRGTGAAPGLPGPRTRGLGRLVRRARAVRRLGDLDRDVVLRGAGLRGDRGGAEARRSQPAPGRLRPRRNAATGFESGGLVEPATFVR